MARAVKNDGSSLDLAALRSRVASLEKLVKQGRLDQKAARTAKSWIAVRQFGSDLAVWDRELQELRTQLRAQTDERTGDPKDDDWRLLAQRLVLPDLEIFVAEFIERHGGRVRLVSEADSDET